jgi:CheY-like chemotaxis protein
MPSSLKAPANPPRARRILVVDDNPSIHADFRKILCPASSQGRNLEALEASLFGASPSSTRAPGVPTPPPPSGTRPPNAGPAQSTVGSTTQFSVDYASQGRDGFDAVRRMLKSKTPYALAFIDMRMPPGWDGIETSAHIWEVDPAIQIVICSAYSDYSWHEVVRRLNRPALRLLQKPFDTKDVLDLAWKLTNKWLSQDPGSHG